MNVWQIMHEYYGIYAYQFQIWHHSNHCLERISIWFIHIYFNSDWQYLPRLWVSDVVYLKQLIRNIYPRDGLYLSLRYRHSVWQIMHECYVIYACQFSVGFVSHLFIHIYFNSDWQYLPWLKYNFFEFMPDQFTNVFKPVMSFISNNKEHLSSRRSLSIAEI